MPARAVSSLYSTIVQSYVKIEATSKRLEMTELLVALLTNTPPSLLDKVVYLTQGKLYPDFVGIELGLAEKMAARAIAQAVGLASQQVETEYKKLGDIGLAAETLLSGKRQVSLLDFTAKQKREHLTIERVYQTLEQIARTTGEGSQDVKITLLANLLKEATPIEARYMLRTVTGRLRLGVADMTIIDALAIAFCGGKENRDEVEHAYNRSSDLGLIAKEAARGGLVGLRRFKARVGIPIRPMLAERLASPGEILEKFDGRCVVEFKYDGERIQAHKRGTIVELFSRRLEKITSQYPDARRIVAAALGLKDVIVEAEAVAVNPESGDLLPFQELMHRRRKLDVEETMESYPVALFFFDVLYAEGEEITSQPYSARRKLLESALKLGERAHVAEAREVTSVKEFEDFFEIAIEAGCEGLMCKSVADNSVYQAGARGWLWIKYKRDYSSELTDSLDLVVVGAFHGRGKRAGGYGALLMAAYDDTADQFRTVCKVGSGFTDEDLKRLPKMLEPSQIPHRHSRVDSKMQPDVWFTPSVVLEVTGAEITLSPLHTAAMNSIREGSGMAIRFPRFTGKLRTDKKPEDATTIKEIVEMYRQQKKVVRTETPAPDAS